MGHTRRYHELYRRGIERTFACCHTREDKKGNQWTRGIGRRSRKADRAGKNDAFPSIDHTQLDKSTRKMPRSQWVDQWCLAMMLASSMASAQLFRGQARRQQRREHERRQQRRQLRRQRQQQHQVDLGISADEVGGSRESQQQQQQDQSICRTLLCKLPTWMSPRMYNAFRWGDGKLIEWSCHDSIHHYIPALLLIAKRYHYMPFFEAGKIFFSWGLNTGLNAQIWE